MNRPLRIFSGNLVFSLKIWDKIAGDWKVDVLEDVMVDCGLEDLDGQIDRILAGQMRGRVVVDLK